MFDNACKLVVCEALTAITRDMTTRGLVDVHDDDVCEITFEELQFDSLDRVELAMELEVMLGMDDDIPEVDFSSWNKIADVVTYIKTVS